MNQREAIYAFVMGLCIGLVAGWLLFYPFATANPPITHDITHAFRMAYEEGYQDARSELIAAWLKGHTPCDPVEVPLTVRGELP